MSATTTIRQLQRLEVSILDYCKEPRTIAQTDARFLPTPTANTMECLRQMGLLEEARNRAGTLLVHQLEISELGEKVLEDYQRGVSKPAPDPDRHVLTKEDAEAIGATGDLDKPMKGKPGTKKPAKKPAAAAV